MGLWRGHEIDALDGGVLGLKLALELLGAATPGGPSAISRNRFLMLRRAGDRLL